MDHEPPVRVGGREGGERASSADASQLLREQLRRRDESQPLVGRHRPPSRVHGHPTGSVTPGFLGGRPDQCRADAPTTVFRDDEDALDVTCGPIQHAGSGHPREKGHPRHPDGHSPVVDGDEGTVRLLVGRPPRFEVDPERFDCLCGLFLRRCVQPDQPGQGRQVGTVRPADLQVATASGSGPSRGHGLRSPRRHGRARRRPWRGRRWSRARSARSGWGPPRARPPPAAPAAVRSGPDEHQRRCGMP